MKELRWTSGCVTGIRGQERGGVVTETASLVVGADGKHSFVADAVASPRYRKRPTATFASYSYWADVPMTSGELYQRPASGRCFSDQRWSDDGLRGRTDTGVRIASPEH